MKSKKERWLVWKTDPKKPNSHTIFMSEKSYKAFQEAAAAFDKAWKEKILFLKNDTKA